MRLDRLIAALIDELDCPSDAQVFFCAPDEEAGNCCLVAYRVAVEYAHDDDCAPFVRVYLDAQTEEDTPAGSLTLPADGE